MMVKVLGSGLHGVHDVSGREGGPVTAGYADEQSADEDELGG